MPYKNPEDKKRFDREWYKANKTTVLDRSHARYWSDPEHQRARSRRYYDANREDLLRKVSAKGKRMRQIVRAVAELGLLEGCNG
jgi:hypothetical protein